MKFSQQLFINFSLLAGAVSVPAYEAPVFPFAGAAGGADSTAFPADDPAIISWAAAVASVTYGLEVSEEWKVPENALGPGGGPASHLLVLGRGGEVVLEFDSWIEDGPGDDFVVFENAFSDTFLELAFVEVSTDGEQFVRFPAYSLTAEAVPAFGQVDPTFVHGFAGKFRTGFGTPFDLDTLRQAHAAAVANEGGFSEDYRNHLIEAFPSLDLSAVRFVRIVDVIGDGSVRDCEGFPVYDPYPTVITAGFDLDAVGVIHAGGPRKLSFADWCASMKVPAQWEEDTDLDKWSNGMEYVLGSDPSLRHSRPELERRILVETGELLVAFDLNPSATVLPVAEVSPDGSAWQRVEIIPSSELWPEPGRQGIRNWGVRSPYRDGEMLLFRLRAQESR